MENMLTLSTGDINVRMLIVMYRKLSPERQQGLTVIVSLSCSIQALAGR